MSKDERVRVKVEEASRPALEWLLCKATAPMHKDAMLAGRFMKGWWVESPFSPNDWWSIGYHIIHLNTDRIINEERIGCIPMAPPSTRWGAYKGLRKTYYGDSRWEAVVKCIVASKLGEFVDVPKEFL